MCEILLEPAGSGKWRSVVGDADGAKQYESGELSSPRAAECAARDFARDRRWKVGQVFIVRATMPVTRES